jgi:hypothetical protein
MPFAPAMRSRLRSATLLLLVATIALVPPLVRATARFGADTASPLRLNRGFESPPSKCTVEPPVDVRGQAVPIVVLSIHVEWFDAPASEPQPHSAPSQSPDPLRGPPLISLS